MKLKDLLNGKMQIAVAKGLALACGMSGHHPEPAPGQSLLRMVSQFPLCLRMS